MFSADWPQWRGPNRDSVYNDRLTLNWPPKVLWRKADIGKSLSGIVVADGTLILHYRQDGQEVVRALDASSGNDLWKQAYDQPLPDEAGRGYGNWPRSTPAITGGLVYTLGYAGKLYATELKTGKVAWNVDTFAEFKHNKQNVQALNFGVTASPLVAGGKVFIPQGTWAKWRMVALDAKSVLLHRAAAGRRWRTGNPATPPAIPRPCRSGSARWISWRAMGVSSPRRMGPFTAEDLPGALPRRW